jgi:predicted transcriptional regulator
VLAFDLYQRCDGDIGQVADTMGLTRHAVSVFVSRERIKRDRSDALHR